ncbi:CLUMA_CG018055, isoform A, partial [Clunio marinus]
VDFNLNGNISCEVTTESPNFYTATATSVLQVVELPHSPPTLWTEFTKYDPGDILKANCSTQPSKPSATITFLLNQYAVGNEPTVYHQTQDNLLWSSKDLKIQILPSHYLNGQLILRCSAEVGTHYADFTEAPLETTRKEPIPERVTSFSRGHELQIPHLATIYLISLMLYLSVVEEILNFTISR